MERTIARISAFAASAFNWIVLIFVPLGTISLGIYISVILLPRASWLAPLEKVYTYLISAAAFIAVLVVGVLVLRIFGDVSRYLSIKSRVWLRMIEFNKSKKFYEEALQHFQEEGILEANSEGSNHVYEYCEQEFLSRMPQVSSPYTHTILGVPPFDIPSDVLERDCILRAANAANAVCSAFSTPRAFSRVEPKMLYFIDTYARRFSEFIALKRSGVELSVGDDEILKNAERASKALTERVQTDFLDKKPFPFHTLYKYLENDAAADPDTMQEKYGDIVLEAQKRMQTIMS